MSPDYFSSMYEKSRKKAGLQGLRLHDLRHYHLSFLLSQGEPLMVVADRVGHAAGRMTLEVYGQWMPENDRHAAEIAVRQLRRTG